MSVYKDEKRGTWIVTLTYEDYYGEKKRTAKRGFKTKKEAKTWENDFLANHTNDVDMTINQFYEIYSKDLEHRIRYNTKETKDAICKKYILPLLGDKIMSKILVSDIIRWQNKILSFGLAPTYVRTIYNQIRAIFNHAEKFYGLTNNPLRKVQKIGTKNPQAINFWTKEEFDRFIEVVDDESCFIQFNVLFYTGLRVGELIALQLKDINFAKRYIDVNKSAQYEHGQYIVTDTKTPKSKRHVTMPKFLSDMIKQYIDKFYFIDQNEQVFMTNKQRLKRDLDYYADKANVKHIRVHDLRHSHASYLIELGMQPNLVQERLGHEKIETTLQTYSHLYPNKQNQLADYLDQIIQIKDQEAIDSPPTSPLLIEQAR